MNDRKKVIKAWEIFRDSNPYEICSGREFRAIREPEYCMGQMIEDTIAMLKEQNGLMLALEQSNAANEFLNAEVERLNGLLKEQEAVKPTWQQGKAYCGACGKRIPLKIGARFCHKCGKPVLWEGR